MAPISLTRGGPDSGTSYEYQWSSDCLQAHLLSDVGKKRTQNEDYCVLCIPEDRKVKQDYGILFAVADGMGGVSGGEFASRLALHTIVDQYYAANEGSSPARLRKAVAAANQRIYEEAEIHPEYHGMGTTVSLVLVKGNCAYVAHVGDSRVYLFRGGRRIWQLTQDHSLVAEQVRNGFISEQEARSHSLKNLITRAVGTRELIKVDLFYLVLEPGDNLLLCTDGLSNVVDQEEMAGAMELANLQGVARTLVGRALEAGGPDNITVAALRVVKPLPKTRPENGAVKVSLPPQGFLDRLKHMFS